MKNKPYPLKDIFKSSAFNIYGCLIPEGEIQINPVYLPWTKEVILGRLKRSGIIRHWELLNSAETTGNMRVYKIVIESKYL